MMISEKKVRVENDFRVGIFEIFHFQKHAPNMDNWRVKKFQNSENLMLGRALAKEYEIWKLKIENLEKTPPVWKWLGKFWM